MILSEQTFIELAGKQEVLDAKIKQAKGITELPLERIELAYRVEAAECVNEMKGDMKYWSNKPMNREAFLEELVDALHFYLSYVNHNAKMCPTADAVYEYIELNDDYEFGETWFRDEEPWQWALRALNPNVDTNAWHLRVSFLYLLIIAEHADFTEQDIVDTYSRKNAVNHDRSDSGVY